MSSRTRSRARAGALKAAGRDVPVIVLPRQRGRRRTGEPVVVVVAEPPSLTRQAVGLLWRFRRPLVPAGVAGLALAGTGVLHVAAPWAVLPLTIAAAAPTVWLAVVQRLHPVSGRALALRAGRGAAVTAALAWSALAVGFGPLAGPLGLVWLLLLLAAQTTWLIVDRPATSREEKH
ncbi:hypothetical protein [Streptomyces sp. NPDC087212]|uniref:hypothetical protein n=1 Tax=Streptomyces sp. NPDC087212 TaxID=3365766 RepID=UPI0037F62EF2